MMLPVAMLLMVNIAGYFLKYTPHPSDKILLQSLAWTEAFSSMSFDLAKASEDRTANMMNMLRLVDVTDRNYNNWFTDLKGEFEAYKAKIANDNTLHCSNNDGLDQDLKTLSEKINLV